MTPANVVSRRCLSEIKTWLTTVSLVTFTVTAPVDDKTYNMVQSLESTTQITDR